MWGGGEWGVGREIQLEYISGQWDGDDEKMCAMETLVVYFIDSWYTYRSGSVKVSSILNGV